jgi:hypothetical protein
MPIVEVSAEIHMVLGTANLTVEMPVESQLSTVGSEGDL